MTPEQEARLKHKAQRHPDYFGSCGYIECRAARAAAPSVEPHEHEYERGAHMAEAFGVDGRKLHCAICGAASPEPTPGLREAIPTISRDLFHGHHPNCGWTVEADPKACDCVVVLRAALAASATDEEGECGFNEPHEPHEYVIARDGKPVDLPCPGLPARPMVPALDVLPEAVESLHVRRWPSGFTASVSLVGHIGEASERHLRWQDAVLDALDKANAARLAAHVQESTDDR